jgi:uncharacterized protein (DUF1810 family)
MTRSTSGASPSASGIDLSRFHDAQSHSYAAACTELEQGRKASHWMWFVFPQLRGLGRSVTAAHFGIASLDEARAYLADPVLGPRLRHATSLLLRLEGRSAREILGEPDDLKLRSSMTLFSRACPDNADFLAVLDRYFEGKPDLVTLALICDR